MIVRCPNCKGQGETRGPQTDIPWFPCQLCDGTGEVDEQTAEDYYNDYGSD